MTQLLERVGCGVEPDILFDGTNAVGRTRCLLSSAGRRPDRRLRRLFQRRHAVALGDIELWEIENRGAMDYPFHLHTYLFRLSRGAEYGIGPLVEDTVHVRPDDRVRIAVPLREVDGRTPIDDDLRRCPQLVATLCRTPLTAGRPEEAVTARGKRVLPSA